MGEGRSQIEWEWLVSGTVLAAYGFFFWEDLEQAGYGVVALGALIATVGSRSYRWGRRAADRFVEQLETERPALPPDAALRKAWRHFWVSLITMAGLGAFSLWRVQMTVWRPLAERYYLFPANTWVGRLEHSWLNDALYAFGMVGLLYVLYTAKEYFGGGFSREELTEERWDDHRGRSTLMIGTGIVIILIWAWLEEIGDLVPGYIFDKWDVNAIYLGFILGYSMMHHLSYPVFEANPPVRYQPTRGDVWLQDGIRIVYVAFVWAYTAFVDPVTLGDRWSHVAELSAIVLGSMWLIELRRRPLGESARLGL